MSRGRFAWIITAGVDILLDVGNIGVAMAGR
jgi:hypothetical protein